MAKLILMKKEEVSVPEEKKGKQIAVKEDNIISLQNFYNKNYQPPVEKTETILDAEPTPIETPVVEQPIMEQSIMETPVAPNIEPITAMEETPAIISNEEINNEIKETSEDNNMDQAINLTSTIAPTEEISETEIEEDLDPELKEIKERLDKVIIDLNNYKKKIKILEIEVNQNLEKSKEVLKDTQAAAKIMSIQQERQRQITEEAGNTGVLDDTRILQKEAA